MIKYIAIHVFETRVRKRKKEKKEKKMNTDMHLNTSLYASLNLQDLLVIQGGKAMGTFWWMLYQVKTEYSLKHKWLQRSGKE